MLSFLTGHIAAAIAQATPLKVLGVPFSPVPMERRRRLSVRERVSKAYLEWSDHPRRAWAALARTVLRPS